MQEFETVVISLHPEHANKIVSGEKKLEFRRVWAKKPVKTVVIYSTSPIQRFVAIAHVKQVHFCSRNQLWALAKSIGGGLTRRALYSYFEGKKEGYAIEFSEIEVITPPMPPQSVISKFRAPQSFSYLGNDVLKIIIKSAEDSNKGNGKVIFVSGVHGVGKSSMCADYPNIDEFVYTSASQLIRDAKASAIEENSKIVKDIDDNQKLLVNAVSKIRRSGQNLLLDGHFAILNSKREPTAIDTDVFEKLKIDGIVTIYDQPDQIAKRIQSRDGKNTNEYDVERLQTLELVTARDVASQLNIPYVELEAFDQNSFNAAIKNS